MSTAMICAGSAMTSAKPGQSRRANSSAPSQRAAIHPAGQPSMPATRVPSVMVHGECSDRCDVPEPRCQIQIGGTGAGGDDMFDGGDDKSDTVPERLTQS